MMERVLSIRSSLAVDCLLFFTVIYLAFWFRSYRRLSHNPGPAGWGCSIFPWLKVHTRPDMLDHYCDLSSKYGPLVRVGPNTLLTSDADVIRRMSAPRSSYCRSEFYFAMRLNPGRDNIFSTRNETLHDDLRRKMAFGYSGKENLALEHDNDDVILELIDLIDRKYISTAGNIKPMDLARKVAFLTSDIMSKVSFDGKFHDLRDDNDNHGYIHEVETLLPNMTWTAPIPRLLMFLTNIGLLQWAAKRADGNMGVAKMKAIAYEQIDKRFDANGKLKSEIRPDMVASWLRRGLTQERAKEETILSLTAGSDTSATTIRATLLCIMTNPRVDQALREEVDEALPTGKIPSGAREIVSQAQAKQLSYLQACSLILPSFLFFRLSLICCVSMGDTNAVGKYRYQRRSPLVPCCGR